MKGQTTMDPRAGLLLLVLSNVIAFSRSSFLLRLGWSLFLCLLTLLFGCRRSTRKSLAILALLSWLRYVVLPVSPLWVATSFLILAEYSLKMYPCVLVGLLMIKKTPLQHVVVGLRSLHVPQKFIVSITVTLRYFPAIREEVGAIGDAMRLRNIRGLRKVEALLVPLMISATDTAEELSAAAVTRGIENPAPKTSLVELGFGPLDWLGLGAGLCFGMATLLQVRL